MDANSTELLHVANDWLQCGVIAIGVVAWWLIRRFVSHVDRAEAKAQDAYDIASWCQGVIIAAGLAPKPTRWRSLPRGSKEE